MLKLEYCNNCIHEKILHGSKTIEKLTLKSHVYWDTLYIIKPFAFIHIYDYICIIAIADHRAGLMWLKVFEETHGYIIHKM